jgi:hypothetical protein
VMEMFTQHLHSHSVTMNFLHTPFFPPPPLPPATLSHPCRRVSV